MAYSYKANKAAQKYQRTHLDDFHVRIQKGKKESWLKAAAERGMTFSGMLVAAMESYIADTEPQG